MSKKKVYAGGLVYSTHPDSLQPILKDEQETLPKEKQRLKISLDTKQRGGKVVTLISGFVGKTEDLEALGKIIKTKCGTGGAVKEGCILIQGDYKTKVSELLKQLGYPVN